MPTVFCTQCGHQNPDDAHFCANCGAALMAPGSPVPSERPVEATSTISLPTLDAFGSEAVSSEAAGADGGADTATDGADGAIDALPSGSAMLVVLRGPNAGSRFLLDRDLTTAGRHPESDIFLDDVTVSRRHAEFRRDGSAFVVRDVGSLNGTYANKDRIDEAKLTSGDEVQIGKFRLVFYSGGSAG